MKYLPPAHQADFHNKVWEIARQIPPGKVATYGQIAGLIPPPGSMDPKDYRAWSSIWVGGAMAACPDNVPWQRVINSQGKISLRPGGGALRQRSLLEAEGIVFDERERVSLKKYGWDGPSQAWLRENGLVSTGGS